MQVIWIYENGEPLRIDALLKQRYPNFSRAYFQELIEEGLVRVNHKIVKKREIVSSKDEIHIIFKQTQELDLTPHNIPLEILYEDEEIAFINKPSGLAVHPALTHHEVTLVHALLYHFEQLAEQDIRPGIVHRLDKETSGVIVVAKTKEALEQLCHQFKERMVEKTYLAIIHGQLEERTIELPVGRDSKHRHKMGVTPIGKSAFTHFVPLAHQNGLTYIKAHPKTGRTHQIRVHLTHIGHPILGDPLYGNLRLDQKKKARNLFLHAKSLTITHPTLHTKITIEAPLPTHFQHALDHFFKIDAIFQAN